MTFIEYILSIVAPHECLHCCAEGQLLCDSCAQLLPPARPRPYPEGLEEVWAATTYEGVAKDLLHALKFTRANAAAETIADCIVRRLPARHDWVVTHVPTAPIRARQRGYDQAQLIARAVALRLNTPYATLLARLGDQRQVGTNRKQREQQMKSAFRVLRDRSFQTSPILLVDDVLTTGATIAAAAGALHAAGIRQASAAVFAAA